MKANISRRRPYPGIALAFGLGLIITLANLAGARSVTATSISTANPNLSLTAEQGGVNRAMALPVGSPATFVVNTDADTDDGACDAPGTGSGNQDCTLREAINAANAAATGAHEITFAAAYTITLGSQLSPVITDITISGHGAANTIIQANAAPETATYRIFEVQNTPTTGTLRLYDVTVRNGQCDGSCATRPTDGGGILVENGSTLIVVGSTIANNSASSGDSRDDFGGGIYNGGTLNVVNSTFSANSVTGEGGAIHNTGTLTVTNSTFAQNSAFTGSGSGGGGGIANDGNGALTVTNSTFDNNASGDGGGIYSNTASGTCGALPAATIVNSTFSGNSATRIGGGIYNANGVMSLLFNTVTASPVGGGVASFNDSATCTSAGSNIISGNTGYDVVADTTTQRFASLGHNLVGVAGANVDFTQEFTATGDLTGPAYDPLLGPLQDNGGPTRTHALLAGSDAINAGDDVLCADATTVNNRDQRGVARPQGNACDIGAFEREYTIFLPAINRR